MLREALDQFGRARFGEKWTGGELYARDRNFGPPERPQAMEHVELADDADSADDPVLDNRMKVGDRADLRLARRSFQKPVRYNVGGTYIVMEYTEALKRWERDKDELDRLWRKEMEDRQRFIEASTEFCRILSEGLCPV